MGGAVRLSSASFAIRRAVAFLATLRLLYWYGWATIGRRAAVAMAGDGVIAAEHRGTTAGATGTPAFTPLRDIRRSGTGEAIPLAALREQALNDEDWRELVGFAFARTAR